LRLLLKLVPKKSHPYINDYHYHLQAAIYSLIREGGLQNLHEKRGYKFFCFSNIFPYGDFHEGIERNLLVSSPDPAIIKSIERAARSKIRINSAFFVGGLQFTISSVSEPFRIALDETEVTVHSATPIVMRIPKIRYEEYGIKPEVEYNYVFWRDTLPFEAFVKQLRDNMDKKWKEYNSESFPTTANHSAEGILGEQPIPEVVYYKFIKTVAKSIILRRVKQLVIGSLWELGFATAGNRDRMMLEFAIDCGLGERNSLGFGFTNPIKSAEAEERLKPSGQLNSLRIRHDQGEINNVAVTAGGS
jgi:CRISPR-associated endoribonuclease Cas6